MMGEAKRRRLAAQAAGVPLEPKTVKLPRSMARLLPSALANSIGATPLPPALVPTTPKAPFSEQVLGLCARLSDATPTFLPFASIGIYRAGQCHANVFHCVRERGGERVNGWIIWECVMFAEAEFHAVWRSPTGTLIDITPRLDAEATILFLPDPKMHLTRGPKGGFVQPANRTTAAEMPYTIRGLPYPHDAAEVAPNAVTVAHCKALGIDPLEICE
jgi:hypothetical protein